MCVGGGKKVFIQKESCILLELYDLERAKVRGVYKYGA